MERKNEKSAIAVLFLCALLCGCQTNRIHVDGNSAADVRDDLSKIQSEQSEINGTAERLKKRLEAAAGTAQEREDLDAEFERVLKEIRNQRRAE